MIERCAYCENEHETNEWTTGFGFKVKECPEVDEGDMIDVSWNVGQPVTFTPPTVDYGILEADTIE